MHEFSITANGFWPMNMVYTEGYLKEKLIKDLDAVHVVSTVKISIERGRAVKIFFE